MYLLSTYFIVKLVVVNVGPCVQCHPETPIFHFWEEVVYDKYVVCTQEGNIFTH